MGVPDELLLAVNGGSSSVKFALFTREELRRVEVGETHGSRAAESTAQQILTLVAPHLKRGALAAVVHRVVHGGERFGHAERITSEVIDGLKQLLPLAPNHLPDEVALIETVAKLAPTVPQIACFDTAFHRTLPEVSHTLPVPASPGLRKYGFHGLSYTFLMSELERVAGAPASRGRVVLAHLGSGASLAACIDGRCVDTSMGLTPAGGVVMSSRAGDLDPSVVTYLARARGLSLDETEVMLTHQSGLIAISGRTADMRELLRLEESDARARLAVDVFCYQVRKWIGAFAAALGGIDTLIFAGGIGEHSSVIRARVCRPLAFLGVSLADRLNAANQPVVSAPSSTVRVRVIPTNEALMMAREARALLAREA